MKKLFNIKTYAAILLCLIFAASGNAQTYENKKQAEKNAGQGVTYKIPNKFLPAPISGFKGMAMLNADAPAGIIISYPNENESADDLSKRLLNAVPGTFFGGKEKEYTWTTKSIEINQGDKTGTGSLNVINNNGKLIQVALFQREWNGLTFVYGYFAMKSETSKKGDSDKYWLDENGKGVKPFDKFVKTFPKLSK